MRSPFQLNGPVFEAQGCNAYTIELRTFMLLQKQNSAQHKKTLRNLISCPDVDDHPVEVAPTAHYREYPSSCSVVLTDRIGQACMLLCAAEQHHPHERDLHTRQEDQPPSDVVAQ